MLGVYLDQTKKIETSQIKLQRKNIIDIREMVGKLCIKYVVENEMVYNLILYRGGILAINCIQHIHIMASGFVKIPLKERLDTPWIFQMFLFFKLTYNN